MDFRTLLKTKEFVILDGAMGTMLQAKGLEMGGTPEALNIDKPDWLVDIHPPVYKRRLRHCLRQHFRCKQTQA